MKEKPARTRAPIHPLIASRWSPRAIEQNKRVERNDLLALLEAARWAPSCYGDQPWRFLVLDRFIDSEAWEKARDSLTDGNKSWVRESPVLIVAFADSIFTKSGKPNRWGQYDTGAASENLCLQASAHGLVAHQMGGFSAEQLRASFQVPERFTPMAVIAIGHPGDPMELPEDKRRSHYAERSRRALSEVAFSSAWANGFE